MPITNELTLHVDNHPETLGRICQALANRGVNIMAFQSVPAGGSVLVCIVVDNLKAAEAILDSEKINYTEGEVAQVKLPLGPYELARAASRLCEANISINYAYSGVEPGTNAPLAIFGVTDVGRAAVILDQNAATASG